MLNNLIRKLEAMASQEIEETPEDWDPYSTYGGNMDDAYNGGHSDGWDEGRVAFAKELLQLIENNI